ncbi:MAG: ribosome biogenesis GTPase Der [Gammaproteobacteria bacterium]
MLPVIAIIGRPNVGKSTLFNRLTRTRNAIVGDMPGLTRDRQYGEGIFDDKRFILVDTGGLDTALEKTDFSKQKINPTESITDLAAQQVWQAVEEADAILFLLDARAGLLPSDRNIAQLLRSRGKNVHLVVNKIDGLDEETALTDFYSLGMGEIYPISAEHNIGTENLLNAVWDSLPEEKKPIQEVEPDEEVEEKGAIKVALIGRPNVGKSTLTNRILGEERVIVCDEPGTTRDSIFVPFERQGQEYILIDTAGVRRHSRIDNKIEKFSVIKTLQAIAASDVVVMLIDARTGVVEQDMWLLGFIIDAGKALVLAVNKWDNLPPTQRALVHKELERRLSFADFAETHFISALHGTGVGDLFLSIRSAYKSAIRKLSTPELTRILEDAVAAHEPPLVKGRRIKMRYAHSGGRKPPVIIIHGNQLKEVSEDYKRYLEGFFRKALCLTGTPVRIEFKHGRNPYIRKQS